MKVHVEPPTTAVHEFETQFDASEQKEREAGARRIQGIARTRKARKEVDRRREMKMRRDSLPAQDDHGHANPSTIRLFNKTPVLHIHHHEETFFELFYDLIIVVVLMKLSYLKYDFTLSGFFTVVAIFANFWSCWSLLNIYVTMVHQEDGIHRLYYTLFTTMAFIMCISTEHPDYDFFHFPTQAFFFTLSGIVTRLLTLSMYGLFYYQDGVMRKEAKNSGHLPKYTRKEVRNQVAMHTGSIFVACIIFAITCGMEYNGTHDDETRRLAGDDVNCSGDDGSRRLTQSQWWPRQLGGGSDDYYGCNASTKASDHSATIVLWLLAVFIEQMGNIYSIIFDKLPFSGEYAGERMQAWLMLCFGESVIGLLINPSYFDSVSLKSIMASFVMVFCLVTQYFDVTDADKFLHLFILRKEKWKAFIYCFGQWPFSMFVFFIGVALKTINYIELGIHDLEVASGCGHIQKEALRRRQLWAEGGPLDKLREVLGDTYESTVGNTLGNDLAFVDGGSLTAQHGRRLAGWTLEEYDELLYRCFVMLCFGVTMVQVSSVLVAYAMPTDQEMYKVHLSRIGSVLIVMFAMIIPFNLQSVQTECLLNYEESSRRRLTGDSSDPSTSATYSSYSSYSPDDASNNPKDKNMEGVTVVEALITTALIVVVSFVFSLFSIDVERSHTYKELEDAAHHGRPPTMTHQSLAAKGGVAFLAKAMTAKVGSQDGSFSLEALKAARDRQAALEEAEANKTPAAPPSH